MTEKTKQPVSLKRMRSSSRRVDSEDDIAIPTVLTESDFKRIRIIIKEELTTACRNTIKAEIRDEIRTEAKTELLNELIRKAMGI